MPAAGTWEVRGGWVVQRLVADLGLTTVQAAGIVGNLGYESAGFTKLQEITPAVPGSRGGYGWAQWTGPRRRHFESWCVSKGLEPSSDEANYGFLVVEVRASFTGMLARLKATDDLQRCVALVERLYEGPAESRVEDRFGWAQRALNGAQSAVPVEQPADDPDTIDMDALYDAIVRQVEALQASLIVAGLYTGEIDGMFGPNSSKAAMEAYKRYASGC
jgi:hypothetical protein